MLQGKCEQCGLTDSAGSFKSVNGKLCCGRCAQQLAEQAQEKKQNLEIARVIDPTICSQCRADNGYQEFRLIGNMPFCPRCEAALYERPFPPWLRLGLAGLLALLGFALVHGAPFFKAGRSLAIGERLVAYRRYSEAIPPLHTTLAIAPDCEKCVLLLGKAELLTGKFEEANKLLTSHNGGNYKKGELFDEVARINARTVKAMEKANQARKLYDQKKWEEAARSMHEAAALYPELPDLADAIGAYDAAVAFEQKDYDRFLDIAEKGWEGHSQSSGYVGMLASALACKYAVTGDPAYRKRSDEMLDRGRRLEDSSPQAKESEKEFEERIRYRLQSRRIIDTDEYNRRFRQKKSGP